MKTRCIHRLGWAFVWLAIAGSPTTASASAIAPLYSVTDLGSGYTLQRDASVSVRGLTSGDGDRTYAFEKSSVTPINERHNGGSHAQSYTLLTLQNGDHKVGFSYDYGGGIRGPGINYPTFEPWSNGWFTYGSSPVNDLNTHGQVVGTSLVYSSLFSGNPGFRTYAAFSNPAGGSHGFGAAMVDNLNNYIASDLGIDLTSALKIDDLGRIIAEGTLNGAVHDFLLTPTGLSSGPVPAPEPSSIATMAVGLTALGFRSVYRRRRRNPGAAGRPRP